MTGRASRYNLLLILSPDQTSGDQPSFKPTLMVLLLFVCFLIFNFVLHDWVLAQLCLTLCDPMDCSLLWGCKQRVRHSLCLRNFPGNNSRMGCHFLLQGIFLIQGSNPCLLYLLHWQQMVYQLRHLGCHFVLGYSQLINNVMIVSGEQWRFRSQINGWMELLNVLGITAK